jgi:hypothetical protein
MDTNAFPATWNLALPATVVPYHQRRLFSLPEFAAALSPENDRCHKVVET